MQRFCIVVPAYNEERRIGATLNEYLDYFERLREDGKLDYEILVVINGTIDNTEKVVQAYIRKNKRISYLNFQRGGKGFAVIEGFKNALKRDNDLIGFVDADMATQPRYFFDLAKKIRGFDCAIASRGLKKSSSKTSLKRRIMSRGFNFMARSLLLLPYRDTQCGAKLFTRSTIEEILKNPPVAKWAFDVELLYDLKNKGFKIVEVATVWEDKRGSKLNLKIVPLQMFTSIVRLRILHSPFRSLIKLYDGLPEWIKASTMHLAYNKK